MKVVIFVIFAIFSTIGNSVAQNPKKDECGDFRWDVKTLTDSRVNLIKFSKPVKTTIEEQVKRKPPKKLATIPDESTTRFISEDTVYKLTAKLIEYKEEFDKSKAKGDHDFHIVLQDLKTSSTLVAEIPNTAKCSTAHSSKFKTKLDSARRSFFGLT